MARIPTELAPVAIDDDAYEAVLTDVAHLLEAARHAAARSVNSIMTATYWAVGRRIVEEEQKGRKRADYGEQPVTRLAKDLTRRYGRGFGYRNLYQMRQFYTNYPRILQTPSAKSGKPAASHQSPSMEMMLAEMGKGVPFHRKFLNFNKLYRYFQLATHRSRTRCPP